MVSDEGEFIVWDICAFVPSKAGLTKEVLSQEGALSRGCSLKGVVSQGGGLSKAILLYRSPLHYVLLVLPRHC